MWHATDQTVINSMTGRPMFWKRIECCLWGKQLFCWSKLNNLIFRMERHFFSVCFTGKNSNSVYHTANSAHVYMHFIRVFCRATDLFLLQGPRSRWGPGGHVPPPNIFKMCPVPPPPQYWGTNSAPPPPNPKVAPRSLYYRRNVYPLKFQKPILGSRKHRYWRMHIYLDRYSWLSSTLQFCLLILHSIFIWQLRVINFVFLCLPYLALRFFLT